MSVSLKSFMAHGGQKFSIERDGVILYEYMGLINYEEATKKAYVGFYPESDVKPNDWIINASNQRLYIQDVLTEIIFGKPFQLKAFYLTAVEYSSLKPSASTVFNISNATGSIIGTQQYATLNYADNISDARKRINKENSDDKEQLSQVINLLEMVVNNQVPPSKGLFSRFSETMERHSWITGTIAGAVLSWLLSQV